MKKNKNRGFIGVTGLFFLVVLLFFAMPMDAQTKKGVKYKRKFFKSNKPDLIIFSLSHHPQNMLTTDTQIFTAIVKNVGNAPSVPCKMRFKIGGESNPPEYLIEALAPGQTRQWKRQAYLNRGGRYRVYAYVDVYNAVVESSDSNNEKYYTLQVNEPGKPDFTVVSIQVSRPEASNYPTSTHPHPNERLGIKAKVKNIGDATATYHYSFRIGGESTPSTGVIHNSRPGHEVTLNRTTSFSGAGRFRITVIVDPDNEVVEKDEENNTGIHTIIVQN